MQTCIIKASLFLIGLIAMLWPMAASAGPVGQLSVPEHQAVKRCVDLILARRLDTGAAKGAFRMAINKDEDYAWIENYFTLEAMVALLAVADDPEFAHDPSIPECTRSVGDYLTFYATDALQEPEGVAHNFEGPRETPQHIVPTPDEVKKGVYKDYDSIDSYAGLFLLTSARYYKLTGKLPPKVPEALLVSLNALNRVINDKEGVSKDGGKNWTFPNGALTNGLSIARATFPHHQLMDEVETYAGLRESVELFQKIGRPVEANLAQTLADGIARGLSLFEPEPGSNLYFFRIDNGNNRNDDRSLYPGILANLFALSYFPLKDDAQTARVWAFLNTKSPDDDASLPAAPSERWLIAASRVVPNTDQVAMLRRAVAANVARFDKATYLDRMAITILSLVGGSAQYPTIP